MVEELAKIVVVIDLETTGLDAGYDEVLDLGICDATGTALVNSLVRPLRHSEWPDAQRVNGITPAMVQDAPTFDSLVPSIREAVKGKTVVIFNADFDTGFMGDLLAEAAGVVCCMLEFAAFYGEWDDYYQNYRWQNLSFAADYVLHEWDGDAHRALADCRATLAVWRYMHDPVEQDRVQKIKKERRIKREVQRMLSREEMEYQRLWERFAQRMDGFWRTWWLRTPLTAHWTSEFNYHHEVEDALAKVFFGLPIDALRLQDRFEQVYRSKKDIPDNLLPASRFKKEVWFQDELCPVTAYISKSGKQAWLLYPESENERIAQRYPLRVAIPPRGQSLFTATQLRKKGLSAAEIESLEPVMERQNQYNQEWYPLYSYSI